MQFFKHFDHFSNRNCTIFHLKITKNLTKFFQHFVASPIIQWDEVKEDIIIRNLNNEYYRRHLDGCNSPKTFHHAHL